MASGLPCVAYDCPCGPRGVLTHGEDDDFNWKRQRDGLCKCSRDFNREYKIKRKKGEKAKVSSENTRSILLWKLGINYLSDSKKNFFLL
jgi:hypothetical protein